MDGKDWQAGKPDGAPALPDGLPAADAPALTADPRSRPPLLSVILPCCNEERNIEPVYRAVAKACAGISLEILFIDDGSTDRTCEAVNLLAGRDPAVRLIRFLRNYGHQSALRAGYRAARGAWVMTMDADMQHPPEAIPAMLAKGRAGFDVVQMVRSGPQAGLFKNLLSRAFYRVFNSLSDVPITAQASDFRMVSRSVCDVLNALPERNLIVRAILPYLGFATASLDYQPADRLFGKASFSFLKSLHLGSDAIFNFSAFPLKLAMRLGFVISVLAFVYGLYNVAAKFLTEGNVPGYTDLIASTLFLGGLILLYLGILGRYVLVILDHLKRRPEYLIAADSSDRPGMSRTAYGYGEPAHGGVPDRRLEGRRGGPVAQSGGVPPPRPEGRRA